jgi:protein SCO1/2
MAGPSARRRPVCAVLLVLFAAILFPANATAVEQPAILQKIGFDQRLNEQVPLDLQFVDETGKTVKLGDYFGEKPVVLVLAYYRCPYLCTQVLNNLSTAMRDLPFTVGKEYNVVTVSFDPHETSELAAKKKKTYVASYGKPGADEGWHFLTGKQDAIDQLTKSVGFRYVYDAKKEQYIHPSGLTILTPHGKIARYFFSLPFSSRDLKFDLIEASAEKIGSPTDQIFLYCFHYDPEMGKYSANILGMVRIGGVLTIIGLAVMVRFLVRRERRKRSQGKAVAAEVAGGDSP